MSGVWRLFAAPALVVVLSQASQAFFSDDVSAQYEAYNGPVASAEAEPAPTTYKGAEGTVERSLWAGMGADARDCWERPEDRWGREPVSAFVKEVGSLDVKRLPAPGALQQAGNGKVWILAWCTS